MNIQQLQRQIALNRKHLSMYYSWLEACRGMRKKFSDYSQVSYYCSEEEAKQEAYDNHKESVSIVPKIAALVDLQKALKKDMQQVLSMQRAERLVENGWLKDHLKYPVPEHVRQQEAAKRDAMMRAGEFY